MRNKKKGKEVLLAKAVTQQNWNMCTTEPGPRLWEDTLKVSMAGAMDFRKGGIFLFCVGGSRGFIILAMDAMDAMISPKLPSKQISRTVLSASTREPVTASPSQSDHGSTAFEDLCIFPLTGAGCWGGFGSSGQGCREHEHQRMKVSWEVISVCCLHVSGVRVMPGKDLKGVHVVPLLPQLRAPVSTMVRKALPGFEHPHLEHSTWQTKFQPMNYLLRSFRTPNLRHFHGHIWQPACRSHLVIQSAGENFQNLWQET